MTEEIKPLCEYCNKTFYNIYALKRHCERCKIKLDVDTKHADKQYREIQTKYRDQEYRIKELERELEYISETRTTVGELQKVVEYEKEKNSELQLKLKIAETKAECQTETILRYEKQLSVLLDKMSTFTYNNIVAGFGEEIRVVHNDILPKCQKLIIDTTNMLSK